MAHRYFISSESQKQEIYLSLRRKLDWKNYTKKYTNLNLTRYISRSLIYSCSKGICNKVLRSILTRSDDRSLSIRLIIIVSTAIMKNVEDRNIPFYLSHSIILKIDIIGVQSLLILASCKG